MHLDLLDFFISNHGRRMYNSNSLKPVVRLSFRSSVRKNPSWARMAIALRRSYKEAPRRGAELSSKCRIVSVPALISIHRNVSLEGFVYKSA